MFIFLDTETTGKDVDDRLCQLDYKAEDDTAINEFFNPGKGDMIETFCQAYTQRMGI